MVFQSERLIFCEREQRCDLLEVFSSVQGEGLRVGERHLFVRTSGCDIHCAYCDTPLCHGAHATARIERTPGRGDFHRVENPVLLEDLVAWVERALSAATHRATSFTGGEPLLQPWVVSALSPIVRGHGARVLLETDGNLPDAFASVRDEVDVLSLDWKAPSATGEPARYEEHARMIEIAGDMETCVKLVYVDETPDEEVEVCAKTVAGLRSDIPLVLQPCTPFGRVKNAPRPERAWELIEVASTYLEDVRAIPQVHKSLDVL